MSEAMATGAIIGAVALGTALHDGDAFEWGLHVALFDVGQADAMVLLAPDGEAAVIDAGHGSTAAGRVADFLRDEIANGIGVIDEVKLGFVTHYDLDHMGGFTGFADRRLRFEKIYDQGPSLKRAGAAKYGQYLEAVGDLDDDGAADPDPSPDQPFLRRRARVGLHWKLGEARIRVVSVRGDTRGTSHDLDLDPSDQEIDENPGSIALLITLGEFELYTAGDQTSDDWVTGHEDTEHAVVAAHVLDRDPQLDEHGNLVYDDDIDVLKVNHHGSDTSSGREFVQALDPEVAIISSRFHAGHRLPKRISIQQLVENGALVYVTGQGSDADGVFADSRHPADDDYVPPAGAVLDAAGDVHIFVCLDGSRYRIFAAGEWRELSALDEDHAHPPDDASGEPEP